MLLLFKKKKKKYIRQLLVKYLVYLPSQYLLFGRNACKTFATNFLCERAKPIEIHKNESTVWKCVGNRNIYSYFSPRNKKKASRDFPTVRHSKQSEYNLLRVTDVDQIINVNYPKKTVLTAVLFWQKGEFHYPDGYAILISPINTKGKAMIVWVWNHCQSTTWPKKPIITSIMTCLQNPSILV